MLLWNSKYNCKGKIILCETVETKNQFFWSNSWSVRGEWRFQVSFYYKTVEVLIIFVKFLSLDFKQYKFY